MNALERAFEFAEQQWRENVDRNVMVALTGGHPGLKPRHVRLCRDKDGLYVRLGKRGQMKKYLKDMAGARIVDADLRLAVFYEV